MLIAKSKAHGGMLYAVFTKLFDTFVQPIIDYGESMWGHKIHNSIKAVHNRAARYFLRVGRKTYLAGFQGDMGWKMSEHRSWLSVVRQWCGWQTWTVNESIERYLFGVRDWQEVGEEIFIKNDELL